MARLSLIKRGIPYRDALELTPDEDFPLDWSWVLTFLVGFGTLDGGRYDWRSHRWHDK